MQLSRRFILGAPLAVAALGPAAAAAAPVALTPVNPSFGLVAALPLMNFAINARNRVPRLDGVPHGFPPEFAEMSFMIERDYEKDAVEFDSLRSFLMETFDTQDVPLVDAGTARAVSIMVMRAGGRVAARSRRAMANKVLVGTHSIFDLGGVPERFSVLHTPSLKVDEMVVMYTSDHEITADKPHPGIMDGPFFAEQRADGSVRAYFQHEKSEHSIGSRNYGIILRAV